MFSRKTSVAVIVAIVLVVTTTLTLTILGVVSYDRNVRKDLENVRTTLAVDANQIGPSLERPIRDSDSHAIGDVVDVMMIDPVLKGAVVKSADGKTILCARERDANGKITETKDAPPAEESLVEKRDVKVDNQTLATVTLFGTTKSVQERERNHLAWVVYNILWVDPLLLLGTALLLRFYVFRPLREIETYAALSCLGRKPPHLRHYHGELESVRLSTEQMLSQLDARNSQVKAEMGERKRAEEGLREKQAQLFLAMDIAKLAYWEFDVEKNFLTGDEKLFQLLGTTSAQEGGLSMSPEDYIRKFVHPSDAALVANEVALGASAKDPNVARQWEHRFIRKDGTEGVMMVVRSRIVVDSAGKADKVLGTTQDITERKKLEQQFLRAQRMESLGVLAGGVAHDLNNSLAPILMAVSLMELQFTDPESQKLIDIVELSARRGVDMVRQLLSFARGVEGRKMELQVGHLIREIEKLTNDTFLKDIQVETDVADNTCPVVGDPTQIQQVLLNLCVNGRDAMPGGGRIYISAENATLDRKHADMNPDAKPGPYVLLKVRDTGTGIPPGIIEKIFDPFFTTKEVGKGTGLGLSTSLAIIKSHGGFIQVQSKMKQGTTFEIYLPAKIDSSRSSDAEIDTELQRGNGELVMIVDDEAEVREIMQQSLEMFGYRTIVASGGDEAAMNFATRHSEIDVVITDMMMPVMNGPVTIQVLRTINPAVRIIATSGLSAKEQADRLGVNHFLMKPYTTEVLLKELKLILAEPAVRHKTIPR